MRVTFLLGSGISIPAGMPCTQDITKQIFAGESVVSRHSTGTYNFSHPIHDNLAPRDYIVSHVINFLKRLKIEIDQYYQNDKDEILTNYEDLYYVTTQIHDSESGNYNNPVVQPLLKKFFPIYKNF